MKSPITDTHLGIDSNADRFAEVRQKAKEDYIQRKTRRDKQEKVPKYKIGEKIVLSYHTHKGNVKYNLVEIVDFDMRKRWSTSYFGIVLKSTIKDYDRMGRLLSFEGGSHWNFYWYPANVTEESIKWEEK